MTLRVPGSVRDLVKASENLIKEAVELGVLLDRVRVAVAVAACDAVVGASLGGQAGNDGLFLGGLGLERDFERKSSIMDDLSNLILVLTGLKDLSDDLLLDLLVLDLSNSLVLSDRNDLEVGLLEGLSKGSDSLLNGVNSTFSSLTGVGSMSNSDGSVLGNGLDNGLHLLLGLLGSFTDDLMLSLLIAGLDFLHALGDLLDHGDLHILISNRLELLFSQGILLSLLAGSDELVKDGGGNWDQTIVSVVLVDPEGDTEGLSGQKAGESE